MAAFRPVAASRYQSFPALVSTLQCLFLYRYHGPRSLRLAFRALASTCLDRARAIDNRRIYSPQSVPATMSLVAKLVCSNFGHSLAILGVCGSLSLLGSLPASAPALAGDEPATAAPAAPPAAGSASGGTRSDGLGRNAAVAVAEPAPIGYIRQFADHPAPPPASMSNVNAGIAGAKWQSTKTMPVASSSATLTGSMSRPSPRPTKRWRKRKRSSRAAIILSSSTHPPIPC